MSESIHPAPVLAAPSTSQTQAALFLVGFVTFALLYATQPLLPTFARQFQISAADSALALSLSTSALALTIFWGAVRTPRMDRRRLMLTALTLAAVLNVLAACSQTWPQLLLCRTLMGLCLGAVPATAMAYVADAVPADKISGAMGLYVAGTAMGGMCGRVGIGVSTDLVSWPVALAVVSALSLVAIALIARVLPAQPPALRTMAMSLAASGSAWVGWDTWRALLGHPRLPRLFLCGGLASGLFVAAYNYASFHLQSPPFSLPGTQVGLIFACYLAGVVSSGVSGRFTARWGLYRAALGMAGVTAVGLGLGLVPSLSVFVPGLAVMTFGFFALHAVCSGWVGREAGALKSQATALYLLSYYVGGSLLGYLGGWLWEHGGWPALTAGLLAALGAIAWQLWRLRLPVDQSHRA